MAACTLTMSDAFSSTRPTMSIRPSPLRVDRSVRSMHVLQVLGGGPGAAVCVEGIRRLVVHQVLNAGTRHKHTTAPGHPMQHLRMSSSNCQRAQPHPHTNSPEVVVESDVEQQHVAADARGPPRAVQAATDVQDLAGHPPLIPATVT